MPFSGKRYRIPDSLTDIDVYKRQVFPESMRCFCEGLHVETLVEPSLETKILLIWKKGKQPTSLLQKFLDICMKK